MSAARQLLESGAPEMPLTEVRRRAAAVLRAHPQLTVDGWPDGWCVGHLPGFDHDRDFDMEQVRAVLLFLTAFGERQQTISNEYEADSYYLKYAVGNWTAARGAFVDVKNGAVILAALMLGYEFREHSPRDLDCQFNLVVDSAIRYYTRSYRPFSPLFQPAH